MTPPDFVPVARIDSEIPLQDLKGTEDWIAFGPEEFRPALPQADWNALSEFASGAHCLVLPVGSAGKLVWQGLPPELALTVASVRPEAVLIFSRQWLRERADNQNAPFSSASFLRGASAEDVTLLPGVEMNVVAPGLPELVPVSAPIPRDTQTAVDRIRNTALKAGLVQVLGDLDGSHELAQSIEGQGRPRNGDYWHAILHRREPDYGNSRYWFRSVGPHPVFSTLAEQARNILAECSDARAVVWLKKLTASGWEPFAFVDLCRECENEEESPLRIAVRRIQWAEMLLLLAECARPL